MHAHTGDPTSVFSTAACYEMPSENFVSMPRGSKHRAPTDMKVDVQYYILLVLLSVHTVNGINDEMNTASLFAVLEQDSWDYQSTISRIFCFRHSYVYFSLVLYSLGCGAIGSMGTFHHLHNE